MEELKQDLPTKAQLEAALRLVALERCNIYVNTLTEDGYWDSTGNGRLDLEINCNDYFCPASDCESIAWDEVIPLLTELLEIEMDKRSDFLMAWVAKKRGVKNSHWKMRKPPY